jgi:hypothetical protein
MCWVIWLFFPRFMLYQEKSGYPALDLNSSDEKITKNNFRFSRSKSWKQVLTTLKVQILNLSFCFVIDTWSLFIFIFVIFFQHVVNFIFNCFIYFLYFSTRGHFESFSVSNICRRYFKILDWAKKIVRVIKFKKWSMDRFYDILNIFAEKFSEKIGVFCSNYC